MKRMPEYIPETKWMSEGNFIYNLKDSGYRHKGMPDMINDVWFGIQMGHLPKYAQKRIVDVIVTALNNEFFDD